MLRVGKKNKKQAGRKDKNMDNNQSSTPQKKTSFKQKLDKFFKITERGSTFKTEVIAGLTTFFAMAYIVVTNPNQIVSFNRAGELDTIWLSVYVASILAAVVGTVLMALYAKMPFAQACGMGLNSFFFVSFILPEILAGDNGDVMKGYKEGLAIILLSGIIFMVLSLTGARTYIAKSLPDNLKKAISAGIGLFIAFLGLQSIDFVQINKYTLVQLFDFNGIIDATEYTIGGLVKAHALGDVSDAVYSSYDGLLHFDSVYASASSGNLDAIKSWADMQNVEITGMHAWTLIAPVVITLIGLCVMGILAKKKVNGAVIYTIAGSTALYYLSTWQLPSFSLTSIGDSFKAFGKEGLFGAFEGFKTLFVPDTANGETVFSLIIGAIILVITFTLVDMFDTVGTLYGAASQANMLDENGDPQKMKECMNSDSIATLAGAALGTSTCTTFVESSAGVGVGGRTGFASLITSFCFLACLFLTPVATIIPACATAPALIYIGVLMLKSFAKVDMTDLTSAIPAFLTLIMMPLTYSISNGIAVGAISYVLIKLFTGKFRKKDIIIAVIAVLFGLRFFLVSM